MNIVSSVNLAVILCAFNFARGVFDYRVGIACFPIVEKINLKTEALKFLD